MEDPIFTISLKPLLFPESFTNSFRGRPLSLHFVFNIRKDSDDQELILTVVRRGQTSEGHRQDDAERTTLIYKFKSNCKVFRKMQSQHMIGSFFPERHEKKEFEVPKPEYSEKDSPDLNCHTEEKIIQLITDYLLNYFCNEKPKGIIVLYSTNSPCIKRKNYTKVSCMFQLLVKAKEWNNIFGIHTKFYFTKYWGPIKTDCSEVIRSIPDRFAELNSKFHIKLSLAEQKELYITDLFSMVPDKKDRNTVKMEYNSIIKELRDMVNEKKSLNFNQHLDEVKKVIVKNTCNPKLIDKFLDNWQKELKKQEKESIAEKFTQLLNSIIVKSFIQNIDLILGESSPIKFKLIPKTVFRVLHKMKDIYIRVRSCLRIF
ncbi:uncharacterized protein LOC128446420 [Pleuronectes platessa]|uniref:uncharacterized protein LOC128446420 n=1 Tax=Pleuronectes platessa TaxID=8262 RepID=UPI00232A0813|nr:uncharacterized protein LOC128446420 [Pleuronectes platessa]